MSVDSMYARYLRERTGDSIIETADGFVTYRYLAMGVVYIVDIYIDPTCRKMGMASALADMVCAEAKAKDCIELVGTVQPSANGATDSLKALLAYGMTLKSAGPDHIILRKDL